MDGGFFLCPDAWEFLLPAEIRHLRDAGSVCQKRWDLLTLTPMGCALLPEPAAVTAGILLLPGDCPHGTASPCPACGSRCCASNGRCRCCAAAYWSHRNFPCRG